MEQQATRTTDGASTRELLQMEHISKSFPGVKALDDVSLTVKAGTVHALMGENGAGKSTLMKCLFGIYNKDDGKIFLDGKEVNFRSSREALDNGVAMVHQELNQALRRNVMDNIWLGRYPKIKGTPVISEKQMYDDTMKVFEELGINVNPKTIMSTMPVSQRQMVEIAKAVSFNAKVIVFDEPTSSLTEQEVEHLFRIINMLRDRGCGIIYISHKMEEILRISDEVTIMRDGQWIATRPAKDLTMNEIIRLMVGRELTNRFPAKDYQVGSDVVLKVEGLTAMYSGLKDVSFELRKGESQPQPQGIHPKRLRHGDRGTARHRYFRNHVRARQHGDLQPEKIPEKSPVPQQQNHAGAHQLVHQCHAHQNADPADADSLAERRQSAEGNLWPLDAYRARNLPAG